MDDKRRIPFKKFSGLLIDYLKPQKGRSVLLGLLLIASISLQLANPQIVRYFLDAAENRSGLDRLLGAALLFVAIALLRQIVHISATYVGENVAWTATNMLRADLALHCLKLDMSFHKTYKPGELIERVDGDVNQLANFFSQLVIRLGGNLLLIVAVLSLLWLQDWRMGSAMTAVASLGLIVLNWLNKRTVPRWQALREADAKLFGYIEEWLNGVGEIRTSRAEPYIMRQLYESLRDRWRNILSAMRVQVLVADLPLGVFALAYSAAHIIGNNLFQDGRVSIGEVYLIFYYLDLITGPLWEILHQIEDLQRATASINRIGELRQVRPILQDGPGVSFPDGPLAVTFDQVSFHYDDDVETDVLKNISFRIAQGTVLGLLGRTGSGKTTLTKLLYRFHDPTNGAITLGSDGDHHFNIRQARQGELRHHIGMVTQEVQLFNASVRHNITLFDETIADKRILEVIRDVGLGDWLDSLPEGLETILEGGGGGLSAGQAQLLALARVFLADPGLVILDEASSRLDPATEQLVERAVDKLLRNRTAIIVAHRLGTVQRADEIMILANGEIAEHGRRLDLAERTDSHFSRLMQTGLEEALA